MSYEALIARKAHATVFPGIEPGDLGAHLFPHQRDLTRWALRRGRAAIFADTGLGKMMMELEWARHVPGRVLILAPLAVAQQIEREAQRFGYEGAYRREDKGDRVTVANYEMLHAFNPARFAGVVLDESSILKSFDGTTRKRLTESFASTPYRLCGTATPAPNDFTELGTHAEFLGVKTRAEMLAEFFVHDGGSTQDWRLKGHAVVPFWRWVATWGAVVKKPSDLGHSDDGFVLPPLRMHEHVVPTDENDVRAAGRLFADDAMTLAEQRAVKRSTIERRVRAACDIALCLGNQSTRRSAGNEARSTPSTGREGTGKGRPGQSKIGNGECEPGRSQTETESPSTDERRLTRGTSEGASGTPETPSTERGTRQKRARGRSRSGETPISDGSSASPRLTTSGCLPSSLVGVPSAVGNTSKPSDGGCSSTTATQPAPSADSSARTATTDSGTSPTTRSAWSGPPVTCESVAPILVWCDLNDEHDALERALGELAFSVRGNDSLDEKEAAIAGWLAGERPIMISKVACLGFGLNFQHCARMVFVSPSHSYEATYQAIRRCWRFGQRSPVDVHIIRTDADGQIVQNYRRKEADAARMAAEMTAHVGDAVRAEVTGAVREWNEYQPSRDLIVPAWLRSAA